MEKPATLQTRRFLVPLYPALDSANLRRRMGLLTLDTAAQAAVGHALDYARHAPLMVRNLVIDLRCTLELVEDLPGGPDWEPVSPELAQRLRVLGEASGVQLELARHEGGWSAHLRAVTPEALRVDSLGYMEAQALVGAVLV